MKYTISEMASLLGVTTHMLRYYEKVGILKPEVNEQTGYRYYTVLDTRRFNLSRQLFFHRHPVGDLRPAHERDEPCQGRVISLRFILSSIL